MICWQDKLARYCARIEDSPACLQVGLIEDGTDVVQETRSWDEAAQATRSMRTKEGLADYRYFPEPDLPPLDLAPDYVSDVQVCTMSQGLRLAQDPVLS